MANLEGKKAPAFSLEGSDGKKHSLDDSCLSGCFSRQQALVAGVKANSIIW
jgi:hypothetical protein